SGVRVLVSTRGSTNGVLAVLAAPTVEQTPVKTCLAVVLEGDGPVGWQCPGARPSRHDLARSHVLVAAKEYRRNALYLVGVARGDVDRIVLEVAGAAPTELYSRGTTWGQFDAA